MIKNVVVTFEFDTETDTVTKVNCSVDGVEKKKRTTTKKSAVVEEMANTPLITLEATKLVFNSKSIADMEIEYEDRIVIKWEMQDKTKLIPIIGKDSAFDEEGSGNKITKTNTVGYRGKQNVVLAELGSEFTIEPFVTKKYPEGIWKLISTINPNASKSLEETIKKVARVEPILIVSEGEDKKIDEMTFNL
ncbi:MAG: hypothetical protein ACOH2V_00890 [Candidatus Saccharimonadaceae bacterium]